MLCTKFNSVVRVVLASIVFTSATIFALTPESPKSIPVDATNTPGYSWAKHVITKPGSYFLPDNVYTSSVGVWISAPDVTLDLNGFKIDGKGVAKYGVLVKAERVKIRNGSVRNCTLQGIRFEAGLGTVENITSSGHTNEGIHVASGSKVVGCMVSNNGGTGGIFAEGVGCEIIECVAFDNGNASWGIAAASGALISKCNSRSNGGGGISTGNGGTIEDSVANDNVGNGISGNGSSQIRGCTARGNGSDGIIVSGSCLIVSCNSTDNSGDGIDAGSSLIQGCIARGNSGFQIDTDVSNTLVDNKTT